MRLLVVEDDLDLHRILTKRLEEEGHWVDDCYDGEEGLAYAEATAYDCVILDWMLPKRDGISVLKALREQGNQQPVLILTAKDAVSNRVVGLDAGADDYLVKPFAFEELMARVRALMRRNGEAKGAVLQIADLVMNTTEHTVTRGGKEISRPPGSMPFWSTCCVTRAIFRPGLRLRTTPGTASLTVNPMWWMCTSVTCATKSIEATRSS